MKYYRTNKFIFSYLYEDGGPIMDVLAHFKGVCAFFETDVQHASRQKEETIYCPCKACKKVVMFKDRQEDFSNDPRNIRFGLSTDGLSPFREMWNPDSTWPVIMCIFNLPPWLCHKRNYLLLTTLISGPKQAGNDIDVFLESLMEDM
jgi:hypothetical protein